MKRIVCIIVVVLLFSASVYAYTDEYPVNAPIKGAAYIEAQVSSVGRVLIVIPINSADYISQQRGSENIINVSSSTITGRMYAGSDYNTVYTFRLSAFGTGQYQNTGNSVWNDISVLQIYNTNIRLLDNKGDNPATQKTSDMLQWIAVFLLGVIVVCQFMKR